MRTRKLLDRNLRVRFGLLWQATLLSGRHRMTKHQSGEPDSVLKHNFPETGAK